MLDREHLFTDRDETEGGRSDLEHRLKGEQEGSGCESRQRVFVAVDDIRVAHDELDG